MAGARYYCSACGAGTVEDIEGWPVASCQCGKPIIAEASATMKGAGGVV